MLTQEVFLIEINFVGFFWVVGRLEASATISLTERPCLPLYSK